jgi:hypothetical protein
MIKWYKKRFGTNYQKHVRYKRIKWYQIVKPKNEYKKTLSFSTSTIALKYQACYVAHNHCKMVLYGMVVGIVRQRSEPS